jgi:DNA processing protein
VVSGLALGIDAAAHAGAVGGGAPVAPPVAVVGAGLDAPCPSANRPLARRVAASGMVCSEVPLGVPAAPWRFPVRNRIVAALARVVVVVESGATGGSMSTVEHALRRDRTVLAVPGPVGAPTSEGTNRLIADGAGVCTGVDDVLAALGRDVAPPGRGSRPALSAPSGLAGRLLDLLGWRPETPDHLVRVSGADPRAVARAVEQLVEVGLVVRRGGFVERCAGPAPDRPT